MGKTAAGRLSGRTWVSLLVFGLFGQLAWTIENMYFNVFLYNTISGDTRYIAAMVAASAVTATVATLLIGALSDRMGKRKVLIVAGYVLWGLSTLSFALLRVERVAAFVPAAMAVQITALLVVVMDCVMTFFGSSANDAAFNAWVTDVTDTRNRGRVESVLAVLPLVAMLIIFGGLDWLTAAGRWSTFFVIIGTLTMLGGLLGALFLKEPPHSTNSTERYGKNIVYGLRPSVIRQNGRLYLALLGLCVYSTSLQVFMPYLIIYIQRYLGIDDYAVILGAVLIASSVVSVALGGGIDKLGKARFAALAVIAEVAGLVLMVFARSFLAVIGAGIVMLGGGMLVMACFSGLVRDYTPEGKAGQFQGIRMIFGVMIPMIIGPFIGSAVIQGSGAVYEELGQVKQVPTPAVFAASAVVLLLIYAPLALLRVAEKQKKGALRTLLTPWGEHISQDLPLPEYPRPQMERDSFLNLNGRWQYAITKTGAPRPLEYDGEILVPFSPESVLSGVDRAPGKDETLWYRRTVTLPDGFIKERVLLQFGAVDQCCTVWVNGTEVCSHEGGYLPFTADITHALRKGEAGKHEIIVAVTDLTAQGIHAYGKQKEQRGGIWYTAQSGIWQTVWLESVPARYIQRLVITPNYDEASVTVCVTANEGGAQGVAVAVLANGERVGGGVCGGDNACTIPLGEQFTSWSPENPFLYDLVVTMGDDRVQSYFGMRKFSLMQGADGHTRLALNNKPYFHNGLLDQGYWSDGLYTPPDDDAMVYDIRTMKELGFTMLRKHIKIEPLRWYYHCDRIGMLVWQDMVSGGDAYNPLMVQILPYLGIHIKDSNHKLFGRASEQGRRQFISDTEETVTLLYNTVSLAVWVPFNEGWGQFDSLAVTQKLWELDPTRQVDHASGWHDQGGGDLKSRHVYYKRVRLKPDGRALALTEFGGYSLPVEGHTASETEFGYRIYRTRKEFYRAYRELYENEVIPCIARGLCAAVYTQVSDVEDEINGLLTYDRRVLKVDKEPMQALNAALTLRGTEELH